jgi:pimeloyl-ACP methyl ester carboxylesterase
MQDYGGPVGFRMALGHPERVDALIVQNAVAHDEGLGAFLENTACLLGGPRLARGGAPGQPAVARGHADAARRPRPEPEKYDPDLWTDEFAFLNKPGEADIQTDLFYDYRTNIDAYPEWQAWMRQTQPRLLVTWGKYDPSFRSLRA